MSIEARFRAKIGVCLLGVALLFACGDNNRSALEGYVIVGLEGNPTTLDPRYATGAYATRILPLLFSSLLTQDKSSDLIGDLAVSWKLDGDRTYVLKIKDDRTFHDGRPVTAGDVKYTYDFLRDPQNGCPAGAGLEVIDQVITPDDRTIIFHLKEVNAPFLFKLTKFIIPAHLADDRPAFDKRPVGSGPFSFEKFNPGELIQLKRRDDQAADAKKVAGVLFRIIENDTTRMLLLKKGDLDLVQNAVLPYSLKFFERLEHFRIIQETGINYQYLGFNLNDPVVGLHQVRAAIAQAIDRQTIIRHLLSGQARPATGLLAPANWAYNDRAPTFDYDPQQAKRMLDEAGFPDPDGDGPAVRFILSYKTSTNILANEVADVIASQLNQVGVGVEKRSFEWGTFYGDIKSGNFQMYSLSWVGITSPDIFHYIFHSQSVPPNGGNRGRYQNPALDALIDQSRLTLDRDRQKEIYGEIQRILAKDLVYVSLWWKDNVIVQTDHLSPFTIYPGGEYSSLAEAVWQ